MFYFPLKFFLWIELSTNSLQMTDLNIRFCVLNFVIEYNGLDKCKTICLLLSPVLIVPPSLGGRLGCGGVVDFRLHALATFFDGNPCIAALARHVPGRQVELGGQKPPVDVLREVDAFAPAVVLRAATLVDALAGRKCCWIW